MGNRIYHSARGDWHPLVFAGLAVKNFLSMKSQNPNGNKNNNQQNSEVKEEKPVPKTEIKTEIKGAPKEAVKAPENFSLNKPPLALVRDSQKVEKVYSHSDLEGIYRLKIGKRRGLDIWIVDGAKVRKELYIDFVLGGNDQRYKFIPDGEIWIDNSISVEELEFTIIHEIFERELMKQGMTYAKAHELAAQEELKARINKTDSIDDLRARWYKLQESSKEQEIIKPKAEEQKPAV